MNHCKRIRLRSAFRGFVNDTGSGVMKILMSGVGACALVMSAGGAFAAGEATPGLMEASHGAVVETAHIYFNATTGERVVTVLGDGETSPADAGGSLEIWSTLVQNPCAAQGYSTEFYYGFDNPSAGTSLSTAITVMDYGDIALDTVVDCIQVNWVVAHPDTDIDSDGAGDGVEELAGEWTMWEPSNGGQAGWCSRLPVISFLFTNLPGNTPDNASAGALSGYTMDVDLVGGFTGTDLSFELGDSDGDCQTAAFCNNDVDTDSDGIGDGASVANVDRDFDGMLDSDLDGDGLFDWSWTVRFHQPGSGNDFDSDSDTGVLPGPDSETIGISFGFPEGQAVDNNDGTWTWEIDTSVAAAGTGEEDRFVLWSAPSTTGAISLVGGYWFGGFACTGGLVSTGGPGYTPPAMFQFALYGPACGCFCPADLNGDGVANFFDVSLFIQDYNNGGDYNGDGYTDFFDVSAYLMDYNAGCP